MGPEETNLFAHFTKGNFRIILAIFLKHQGGWAIIIIELSAEKLKHLLWT